MQSPKAALRLVALHMQSTDYVALHMLVPTIRRFAYAKYSRRIALHIRACLPTVFEGNAQPVGTRKYVP